MIHAAYRKAERVYRQEIHKFEIKREQRVIERDNAGSFFRFVNSKLTCKRGLGALKSDCGDVITGDQERANLLNTYFTSMCTDDNGTIPTFDRVAGLSVGIDIETIAFTPGLVKAANKRLKLGGTNGPDGLPPCLFKKLADSIAEPLSYVRVIYVYWQSARRVEACVGNACIQSRLGFQRCKLQANLSHVCRV